jgi:hypothetical protein
MFNSVDQESHLPEAFDFSRLSQTDLNIMGILGEHAQSYRLLVMQGTPPQPVVNLGKTYIIVDGIDFDITEIVPPQSLNQPGQAATFPVLPTTSQLSSWQEFFRPTDELTQAAWRVKQEGWTNTSGVSVEQIVHDNLGMWVDQYFDDETTLGVLPEVTQEVLPTMALPQPDPQTEEDCENMAGATREEKNLCKEMVRRMRDNAFYQLGLCEYISDPKLRKSCIEIRRLGEVNKDLPDFEEPIGFECDKLPTAEERRKCWERYRDLRGERLFGDLEEEPQTEEDCEKYTGTARTDCLEWLRQIKKAKELADRGIITSEKPGEEEDENEKGDSKPKPPRAKCSRVALPTLYI